MSDDTITLLNKINMWVEVALTLFILSFLFKDNFLYKFSEHLFVGTAIGYAIPYYYKSAIYDVIVEPVRNLSKEGKPLTDLPVNKWMLIIPIILGLIVFARVHKKTSWLSRFSFAFLIGYASGVAIPSTIGGLILPQTAAAAGDFAYLLDSNLSTSELVFKLLGSIFVFSATISILIYFLFSVEHKGAIKYVSSAGILFIMIGLGIAYGNTVMGRMSLLWGRFSVLKEGATSYYAYCTIILGLLVVAYLVGMELARRNKPNR